MAISADQKTAYAEQGYLSPIDVFSAAEVATLRAEMEHLEAHHGQGAGGHDLAQFFRVNGQIVLPFLAKIAQTPAILDVVSGILGPDLLVWSVEFFIKEPGSAKTVSWHQDLTYWGMGETDEELTAWIALSDVSVAAGCMRFIPGSHKGAIVDHEDTFSDDNLLSRGQQIVGINESDARHGPLKPGQMSLHHGRVFHASGPNTSDDRRIGVAIRYVTPDVKQAEGGRDYAMLVRGCDRVGGWIPIAPPSAAFEPRSLTLYDEVLAHQSSALAAGATQDVGMYSKGQAQ